MRVAGREGAAPTQGDLALRSLLYVRQPRRTSRWPWTKSLIDGLQSVMMILLVIGGSKGFRIWGGAADSNFRFFKKDGCVGSWEATERGPLGWTTVRL